MSDVFIPSPLEPIEQEVDNFLRWIGIGSDDSLPARPDPEPLPRQVGDPPLARQVGGGSVPSLGELRARQEQGLFDEALAMLDAAAVRQSSGGGGGNNDGARRAAFNAQRDGQVAAYQQQIDGLEAALRSSLDNLRAVTAEQLAGFEEQEFLASRDVDAQYARGREVIDSDLADLLAVLSANNDVVSGVADDVSAGISARYGQGRDESADYASRLLAAGGGDRTAAAAVAGADRSRALEGIDAGLVDRLAQAAAQDFERRRGSAVQVADGARGELSSNRAALLSGLAAALAAQVNAANVSEAERRLDLEQSYRQQILAARAAQAQAAAQQFVPAARSYGSSAPVVLPSEQYRLQQAQNIVESRLFPEESVATLRDQLFGGGQGQAAAVQQYLAGASNALQFSDDPVADNLAIARLIGGFE